MGEDGDSNDDGQGVEVAEQVIGSTMGRHGPGLRGGDGTDTAIVDVVDGEVEEDGASLDGADDIINSLIGPCNLLTTEGVDALGTESRRVGLLPKSLDPESALALLDGYGADLDNILECGSIGCLLDQTFVQEPKQKREQEVDDAWLEECKPVTNVFLTVGGGDGKESTDVDATIEDQHDPLDGDLRINNDLLASLDDLGIRSLMLVLVDDGGSDAGLEHT